MPGGALPLVGVYSDYGNPRPQVMVANTLLLQRFPDVPRLRFGLRVDPRQGRRTLRRRLRAKFGLPDRAVIDQAGIKASSLQVFERTFAVTAALNVLTLGVAGVAMFASLITLSGMRLPQLAPVWAMGLTRRRLAGLDFAAHAVAGGDDDGVGAALGAGAGLGVVVGGECGGLWLAIADASVSGRLAAATGAGAVGGPAGRGACLRGGLARLSPSDLLRVFAHER